MERLKELASHYLFPIILILIGAGLMIYWTGSDQTDYFLYGSLAILISGLMLILYAAGAMHLRIIGQVLAGLLFIGALVMAYWNYDSVQRELAQRKKKEQLESYAIQGLKDIRKVEVIYESRYGKYAGSFDTLLHFLRHDSIQFVRVAGADTLEVPDTLTQQQAIEEGILQRDTIFTPVKDSLFNEDQGKMVREGERAYPFLIDSLPYKRGTGDRFILKAGKVDQGGVSRPVFAVKDPNPKIPVRGDSIKIDNGKGDTLKVGSMQEPSKSGNWGDY